MASKELFSMILCLVNVSLETGKKQLSTQEWLLLFRTELSMYYLRQDFYAEGSEHSKNIQAAEIVIALDLSHASKHLCWIVIYEGNLF